MKVVAFLFFLCLLTQFFASRQLRFSHGILGAERFKKFREAYRKEIHLVAPLKTPVVTSYDQKTQKVNDSKNNDYFNVSVRVLFH